MSTVAPVVHAVVEPELKQTFSAIAHENERTEAAELRIAVRRHVDAHRAIALAAAAEPAAGDGDAAA